MYYHLRWFAVWENHEGIWLNYATQKYTTKLSKILGSCFPSSPIPKPSCTNCGGVWDMGNQPLRISVGCYWMPHIPFCYSSNSHGQLHFQEICFFLWPEPLVFRFLLQWLARFNFKCYTQLLQVLWCSFIIRNTFMAHYLCCSKHNFLKPACAKRQAKICRIVQ